MATFVLVHGAWHGGWCWRKVTRLLRANGHEVCTPTLTGLGERTHLGDREVGLGTHVQDVVQVLEYEDLHEVVLVGHSYGGMVITGAAACLPERLAHLIYLDAFVPEDGQSLTDFQPPAMRQEMEERVRNEGQGWLIPSLHPMPWDTFLREVWAVNDAADRGWLLAHLRPQPFKTFTEPVRRTNAAAEQLPRTYIRCTGYANPMLDRFAAVARDEPGSWRYRALQTSHDAMVTMPHELADLLLELS